MSYLVEVEHRFAAQQGLPSPVRARAGRALIPPGGLTDVTVAAGVTFADDQLTERGWFFDTDAAAEVLAEVCADLAERPWTGLFGFRPTFELVARHLFDQLAPRMPQLSYVELRDETFHSRTRFTGR